MLNRNPKLTFVLAMTALLAANLLNFAKHWMHGDVWPGVTVGFFYGVTIGLMILALWQRRAHR